MLGAGGIAVVQEITPAIHGVVQILQHVLQEKGRRRTTLENGVLTLLVRGLLQECVDSGLAALLPRKGREPEHLDVEGFTAAGKRESGCLKKVSVMTQLCQGFKKKDLRPEYPDDSNVLVLPDNGIAGDRGAKRGGGKSRRKSKSKAGQVNRLRAERLLETELGYVHHDSFEAAGVEREIFCPPAPASERPLRKPPRDADFYLAHLYEIPLLGREEETHLFRKMNFLKFRADRLRQKLNPARATRRQLDTIDWLRREAMETRNRIVEANLRLVFSLAKRYATAE